MIQSSNQAGNGARSPLAVPKAGWLAILKRTWAETGEDNIGLIAAGIAFYMFAAIVPSLGAVVLSYGLFADAETVRHNVAAIFSAMPREAATVISEQLLSVIDSAKDKQGFGLILALGIAYYGATKGASAITTGLNVAYDVQETRGFVRTTLLSLAIVAGGVLLIVAAALATALLGFLERLIPGAPALVLTLIRITGYLLLAALVMTAAAILFRFVPDRPKARWVWLSPGAILATVAWLAGTSLFGLYVSNFGNYGATYGSLSAVIVLLTWLWLTAYVFLLGAELNAELERQVDGEAADEADPSGDRQQTSARPERSVPSSGTPHPAGPIMGPIAGAALATGGIALLRHRRLAGVAVLGWAAAQAWRRHRAEPRPVPAAVLFDIDGTLIDSNDLHVTAWHRAFAEAGHDVDRAAIHDQIGKGADNLVPALLPDLSEDAQHRLADAHGRLFKQDYIARAKPFPGARALIERVHAAGSKVVLASSASGEELDHYVALLGIESLVSATTSSDDVDRSKPAPDIFAVALKKAGVPGDAAIAIGDTPYDIQSAGKAGMATIAVLSGGFDRHALERAGAIAIHADVADLCRNFATSRLNPERAAN
ncbi:YhjD/YihY/BrkB family envelope integrity protein [Sphingomonas sp. NPDC019816]|uniref:YhjD/YihY/BrkB family envelope integrity protein n=1 Tax=Sphingomonas sp. NPDC019816 TaxID=3390679 RepID=UPI003CFFF1AC